MAQPTASPAPDDNFHFSMMPVVSPGALLRLVSHSLAAVLRARPACKSTR
jgi:hypothetical protein